MLDTRIKEQFAPVLRTDGFKGTGRTFRALRDDLVLVVNVQGSNFGGKFYVNLGVQPLTCPSIFSGQIPDPKSILEYKCEFRRRLSAEGNDQSWDYTDGPSTDRAVADMVQVYQSMGRAYFARFIGAGSVFSDFEPDSELSPSFALDLGTVEGNFLRVMAYLRLAQGKISDAVRFAERACSSSGSKWVGQVDMQNLINGADKRG